MSLISATLHFKLIGADSTINMLYFNHLYIRGDFLLMRVCLVCLFARWLRFKLINKEQSQIFFSLTLNTVYPQKGAEM